MKIQSYQDAKNFLSEGRNPLERPYANNTRIYDRGDSITVEYHGNEVVTFYPNKTRFDSCGWRTFTTKERLNWFLPDGFYVYQEKGIWYLSERGKGSYIFADGIEVDSNGKVYNAESEDKIQEIKALTKQINKYVKGYIKALVSGEVESPSGGDCWYCAMYTDSGESLGDATRDTSHLLSHFEESYYVPSLLYNAYKLFGGLCIISQDAMARLWQSDETLSDWQAEILRRDVKALLTKYIKKQFGIAQ